MPFLGTPRPYLASVRVAAVAAQQWGIIGLQQLYDCGVSYRTIGRWVQAGRLHPHPYIPHVYIVGHVHVPIDGHLTAALLHAGPGAALAGATDLCWHQLIPRPPALIHVATPNRTRSCPGVVVHHPRTLTVIRHRRLPVTPIAAALVMFARTATDSEVRRALAEAEYRDQFDLPAIRAELRRGRPGSARVRRVLPRHEPRLARTKSRLERRFIAICETHGIPLPEVNVPIGRMTVDAVWPEQRVAVELDGHQGHRTRAQTDRDRRREFHARRHGFTPVRYSEAQLDDEPELVAADVLSLLAATDPR
jgi:uncharacterized protein DUF559